MVPEEDLQTVIADIEREAEESKRASQEAGGDDMAM